MNIKIAQQQYMGEFSLELVPIQIRRDLCFLGYKDLEKLTVVENLYESGKSLIWLIIDDIYTDDDNCYTVTYGGYDKIGIYSCKDKLLKIYEL